MAQYRGSNKKVAETSEDPVAIVGSRYCAPYQMDLTFKTQHAFFSADKYVVKDVHNNNIIFNVKPIPFSLHNKKVIFDAAGNPILTLYCKIFSLLDTWKAFRGESSDEKDLIFRAKSSTILHPNTKFNVYKANNSSKNVPDFKVKGKWWNNYSSVAIYAGESSTILAQVKYKFKAFFWKKTFVTVYPNIDLAFVTAMLVLLETAKSKSNGAGG